MLQQHSGIDEDVEVNVSHAIILSQRTKLQRGWCNATSTVCLPVSVCVLHVRVHLQSAAAVRSCTHSSAGDYILRLHL